MSGYGADKVRRLLAIVEVVTSTPTMALEAALEGADEIVDRLRASTRAGTALRLTHPQFVREGRRFALSVRAARAGIPAICVTVADVCYALLGSGFCSRGAVVVGETTHGPEGVSGPAVIEALSLMREQSLPRVVVSPAAELVVRQFWEPSANDLDGCAFFNFFRGRTSRSYLEPTAKIRRYLEAGELFGAPEGAHAWLLRQLQAAEGPR